MCNISVCVIKLSVLPLWTNVYVDLLPPLYKPLNPLYNRVGNCSGNAVRYSVRIFAGLFWLKFSVISSLSLGECRVVTLPWNKPRLFIRSRFKFIVCDHPIILFITFDGEWPLQFVVRWPAVTDCIPWLKFGNFIQPTRLMPGRPLQIAHGHLLTYSYLFTVHDHRPISFGVFYLCYWISGWTQESTGRSYTE